ncbi:hypothetical protein, partial [Halalkalibacter flavus]|uniref:hypothetical protein n=1 Tax=Halalkalibacter flavus TaxID=3090668 RepID=UPI002FCA1EDF
RRIRNRMYGGVRGAESYLTFPSTRLYKKTEGEVYKFLFEHMTLGKGLTASQGSKGADLLLLFR